MQISRFVIFVVGNLRKNFFFTYSLRLKMIVRVSNLGEIKDR